MLNRLLCEYRTSTMIICFEAPDFVTPCKEAQQRRDWGVTTIISPPMGGQTHSLAYRWMLGLKWGI